MQCDLHGAKGARVPSMIRVVPALYALWFRVRSDETVNAPAFHPQRMEPFNGERKPIRNPRVVRVRTAALLPPTGQPLGVQR